MGKDNTNNLAGQLKKKDVGFEEFYAFDSTAATLFSDIMKGVGHKPKDDGKKKGGSIRFSSTTGR